MKKDFTRPEVLTGYTLCANTPCGSLYLTLNDGNDHLTEIRATLGKSGTCTQIMLQTIALLLSVMLQEGIPREKIKKTLFNQFGGFCGQVFYHQGDKYNSCVDFIVTKMLEDMAGRGEIVLHEE